MAIVIKQNVSLKDYNTLSIEAESRYFATIDTIKCLQYVLLFAHQKRLPRLVLGQGSNIVIGSDFPGISLHMAIKGYEVLVDNEDYQVLKICAGENWDNTVKYCIDNELYGLENLSLIPGNVGAAPMQNIGAYGVELKDVLVWVEVWNIEKGREERMGVDECELGYRDSIFKGRLKDQYVITAIAVKLSKNPRVNIAYKDLQEYFATSSSEDGASKELGFELIDSENISPAQVREAVIDIRLRKLPDPRLVPNVGSFFKNPIVSDEFFAGLKRDFDDIPNYPQSSNKVKLSAAWLIDKAGWKGYHADQVGVHEAQPLVLINMGEATGENVLVLAGRIRSSVMRQFDVMLEMEPEVV